MGGKKTDVMNACPSSLRRPEATRTVLQYVSDCWTSRRSHDGMGWPSGDVEDTLRYQVGTSLYNNCVPTEGALFVPPAEPHLQKQGSVFPPMH